MLLAPLLLLAAACATPEPFSIAGQPVEVAATQQIEGSIADDFGMPLVANCPVVAEPAIGGEFTCTASTSTGQIIDFAGTIQAADQLDIASTNVVSSTALDEVREQLAADLTESTGFEVTVDCPSNMITMDAPTASCTASSTTQPDTNPIGITFTNPRSGSYRVDISEFTLFDPRARAIELIETELTDIVGVPLIPTCPEQIDVTVGFAFQCTGETPDGRMVEFVGTVDRVRHIDMQTTNFLREEVVQAFEIAAADALAPQTLTDTTVDCQPRPVLFNERGQIQCDLTLANDDQPRTVTIQIEDFSTLQFTVSVETPTTSDEAEDTANEAPAAAEDPTGSEESGGA